MKEQCKPTSEEEKMLFVSDEHYKREKNAFCLAKWAIEAELNKKRKNPEDYRSFHTLSSNEARTFPRK